MYYRFSDAFKTFDRVDHEIWDLIWRWCKRRHKRKGRKWIYQRYYEKTGNRNMTFKVAKTGYTVVRARHVIRLKYNFNVTNMSPLDPNPKVREIWRRRKYEEIRYTVL